MNREQQFEGKTLDEALEAASRALGLPAESLDYEMVDEGRKGILGLGARNVRIVVELPAQAARARARVPKPPERAQAPGPATDAPPAEGPAVGAEEVLATVRRMLRLMQLDLQAEGSANGGQVRIQLSGRDRRMLLQKDGQLLQSLQFILNRMARRTWPEVSRIQVQANGRQSRRDEEIMELAREVASQVARTGQAKKLQPMNPYERRLVHMVVRETPGVVSRSHGEGFKKTITVEPDSEPRPS